MFKIINLLCVNINVVFKKTKIRRVIFHLFCISLMFGLMQDNHALTFASEFNSLQYHLLCSFWKIPPYTQEKVKVKQSIS